MTTLASFIIFRKTELYKNSIPHSLEKALF